MIQSKINVNAKKFINIDETWWRLLCQTPCLDQEIDSLKWPSDAGSSYKTHIYDVGMCFHLPYPYTSPNRVTMAALVMMNFLIVYRSWCCRYQVRPSINFASYQSLYLVGLGKELVSFARCYASCSWSDCPNSCLSVFLQRLNHDLLRDLPGSHTS